MRSLFNVFWAISAAAAALGFLMILSSAGLHQTWSDIALILFSIGLILFLLGCHIAWGTRKQIPPDHESVRDPNDPATAYLPEVKQHGK